MSPSKAVSSGNPSWPHIAMVLLKVTVDEGTLDELSPQQVIDWAAKFNLQLEESFLEPQQWIFLATEKKDDALRPRAKFC